MTAPALKTRPLEWFELPAARQFLSGLQEGRDCGLVSQYALYGEDGQRWALWTDKEPLTALREEAIDALAGYSRESVDGENFDDAKFRHWLACDDAVPSISDAVEWEMSRREGRAPRQLFKGLVQGDADAFRKAIA